MYRAKTTTETDNRVLSHMGGGVNNGLYYGRQIDSNMATLLHFLSLLWWYLFYYRLDYENRWIKGFEKAQW